MTERDIVDELREIQRMNTTLHGAQMAARAADEIERLQAERDEARREVCVLMRQAGFLCVITQTSAAGTASRMTASDRPR